MEQSERRLKTYQRIADILAALCLLSGLFLLLCLAMFPKTGMESLGIIVPWLVVFVLNVCLVLPTSIAAFMTKRILRNLWIYGYFLLFFGANAVYYAKVQRVDVGVAKLYDNAAFPEEMALNRNLETLYISVTSGRRPDSNMLEESKNLIRAGADVKRVVRDAQRTPIMHAAGIGDSELVKLLVAHGADLRVKEGYFLSPLMEAVKGEYAEIVAILLRASADPNVRNYGGASPLLVATKNGDVDTVRHLLSAGANPRANPQVSRSEGSALYWAVSNSQTEIVRLLLSAGADPMDRTPPNESLLTRALRNNSDEIAALLQAYRQAGNDLARSGRGDLYRALDKRDYETFRALLDMGVDANERDHRGRSLLYQVASQHEFRLNTLTAVEVAATLLDHGADVDAATEHGMTSLMAAADSGNSELLALLIEHDAVLDAVNSEGTTALTIAAKRCDQNVVDVLLAAGADPNARANGGRTALMSAARQGCREAVDMLLTYGADPNARTELQMHLDYPLLGAVLSEDAEIVRVLIEAGAIIDESGRDKCDLLNGRNPEILRLLIQTGVNLNTPDEMHRYPLMGVLESGKVESVQLLLESGASPDVIPPGGNRSVLLVAARHCRGAVLPLLLDHSETFREDRRLLERALWTAVRYGNVGMVEALLKEGVSVSLPRAESAVERSEVLQDDPVRAAAMLQLFQTPRPD
ncbi:MAG: hypothetical protein GY906_37400 [bacterium]|nr:hypothetical protein [bacterium]